MSNKQHPPPKKHHNTSAAPAAPSHTPLGSVAGLLPQQEEDAAVTGKEEAAQPLRVALVSLGCAKNLVDGEIMLGTVLREGLEITNDPGQADVLILNTCSFIDAAKQESVDAILQSAEAREAANRGQALVVSGCLPQRYRDELPKLLPEVDAFMGVDQVSGVTAILREALKRRAAKVETRDSPVRRPARSRTGSKAGASGAPLTLAPATGGPEVAVNQRPNYIPDYATPRFRLTPRHFAYVKIAEGCNHPCSFCTIPRMRGAHRSRPLEDIVAESQALLAEGVKELNLISQDSTYYGLDLRPKHSRNIAAPERFGAAVKALESGTTPTICSLLRRLNELPGEFWIRLLYTHPAHWTDQLIQTLAECPKVARYVDIPLQHIHQNMLERMRRETSQEYIVDLLRRIRAGVPGIALRTTFIVGFPGETEAHFETLLEFIRAARFERLGIFTYSQEEGTRAGQMAGQIPEREKRRRRSQAMAAQQKIAETISQSVVGRTLRVLVEGPASEQELRGASVRSWEHGLMRGGQPAGRLEGQYMVARSEADAPDIDGRLYVRGQTPPGQFARVKVVGHTTYDLIAEQA